MHSMLPSASPDKSLRSSVSNSVGKSLSKKFAMLDDSIAQYMTESSLFECPGCELSSWSAGEVYTKLGQSDFQAELSALRAVAPETTMVFQPGGMGINFVKQWKQAGMDSSSKLYQIFSVDGVSIPALKESALGILGTMSWSPDLDNEINKKFVTDKMRAALAKGNIPTTRGVLKMNSNHFPIQNFYLRDTVKDADGVVTTKVVSTVFADHADSYAASCKF